MQSIVYRVSVKLTRQRHSKAHFAMNEDVYDERTRNLSGQR